MIPRIQVKAEVSFVNLIDVMLVLLIIFMITAPVMHNFLDVDLPSSKVSKANISEGIIVTIKKDGSIYIDRKQIKNEDFSVQFSEIWKKRSGEPVYVNADRSAPYGSVIDVIGIVKKAGGDNVGLVVEQTAEKTKK